MNKFGNGRQSNCHLGSVFFILLDLKILETRHPLVEKIFEFPFYLEFQLEFSFLKLNLFWKKNVHSEPFYSWKEIYSRHYYYLCFHLQ